jgi:thiaminase/transcriptional activator TenA
MSERFSEQLRRKLDAVWEAQHAHPFVRGIGDGTLEETRFQLWLRQDYLFLVEYARLFSLAAARAPDLETTRWMMGMAQGVLHSEMLLHQSFAVEFGLLPEDLEQGSKLPTTQAYTDHLLRTAALGSYLELVAALLPCVWGDAEIGQRLGKQPIHPVQPLRVDVLGDVLQGRALACLMPRRHPGDSFPPSVSSLRMKKSQIPA